MTDPVATKQDAVAPLDAERLITAISNAEWAWMRSEGRFPAPDRDTYAAGLRRQVLAMSDAERRVGPMSSPDIAAEYRRLSDAEMGGTP